MRYPAVVKPDGSGFMVSFPDIPEALTSGATKEEALEMASASLATAMDFYFEDGRPVPLPGKVKRGQSPVELPPSLVAKVLLLNEMLAQKVKPAELARRMGTPRQEVNRLIDLKHTTKIDTIADALKALGKHLEVGLAA